MHMRIRTIKADPIIIFAAAVLLAAISSGCGKEEQASAAAEGGGHVYRIAFASFGPDAAADNAIEGYLEGLASEGFKEGRNLKVIKRHGFGEISQLPQMMQSLDSEGLDLLVPMSTPCLSAAFGTVNKTPMVFVYTYDPIGAGAGKSFEDHIPNATGVASFPPIEDTMRIIIQLCPDAKRLGTVYNASEANSVKAVGIARKALKDNGIELLEVTVTSTAEVLAATQALLAKGPDAVWITGDNTVFQALEAVIRPVSDAKLPLVINDPDFVDRGALLGVGIGWRKSGFAAGKMAARVLRGESPAEMPIVSVAERNVVLNHDMAKKLGISFPKELLNEAQKPKP